VKVKKIISVGRPGQIKSDHIRYGIQNEETAIQMFVNQMSKKGCTCSVRKCGLFVEVGSGVLAATPDRLASIDGEELVLEVKCLSASRSLTPLAAVTEREKDSGFGFFIKDGNIALKKKHKFFYQVQMQMALTGITTNYVIIFTSSEFEVAIVKVEFDEHFWKDLKEQLLVFHSQHVLPALVQQRFK